MSHDRRTMTKQKRKSKKRRRIFTWILLPMMVLLLSATAYGAYLFNKAETAMNGSYNPLDRESKRTTAVQPDIDNISLLIIGVDDSSKRGFSTSSRSDALMVATFNKKAKSIKLLSIPRDSYVHIPKLGYQDKITHAHANGGPITTIETVEEMLDMPIDFYVKVNFDAFIEIIDALDGIDIEVPYAFSEQDSNDVPNAINLEAGYQTLDGEEALALARTRKMDSDVFRGKRQQEIIKAIVKRAASFGSVSKYGNVIEAVGNNMETDLSFDQMKAFIDYASAGTSLNIENLNIDGQDLYLPNANGNNVYYYQIDEVSLSGVSNELKRHLELGTTNVGQSENYQDEAQVEEPNTEY
ncbi:LCP family protein [Cytobacillus purgationiresistens]|uniref:LCP family protein required for cell wall assembly n=1 Tax=Cytobacillus purgationiresistens TaxID=863449 RepID=A0ABU0AED7_9BACI|nr:LCP family protein [Cytobacillus purgationiresistens]MDQ0269106.1 LCP family protein required for cell wall assembly [Cytobacillus purgationiresistens]